jgi:hypothetical protein
MLISHANFENTVILTSSIILPTYITSLPTLQTTLQLNLSETYSPFVPFFREAELRHGRTAMLAVMGYIAADVVRIPGEMYSFAAVPHAVDAHDALLKTGPMYQLLLFIGLFDLLITAPAIGATSAGEREAGGMFDL